VIEVRGDAVLISESLDEETMLLVEGDFWPQEKPLDKAASGQP
jgi:hypothetical protein